MFIGMRIASQSINAGTGIPSDKWAGLTRYHLEMEQQEAASKAVADRQAAEAKAEAMAREAEKEAAATAKHKATMAAIKLETLQAEELARVARKEAAASAAERRELAAAARSRNEAVATAAAEMDKAAARMTAAKARITAPKATPRAAPRPMEAPVEEPVEAAHPLPPPVEAPESRLVEVVQPIKALTEPEPEPGWPVESEALAYRAETDGTQSVGAVVEATRPIVLLQVEVDKGVKECKKRGSTTPTTSPTSQQPQTKAPRLTDKAREDEGAKKKAENQEVLKRIHQEEIMDIETMIAHELASSEMQSAIDAIGDITAMEDMN
jgi:hypothetical protein